MAVLVPAVMHLYSGLEVKLGVLPVRDTEAVCTCTVDAPTALIAMRYSASAVQSGCIRFLAIRSKADPCNKLLSAIRLRLPSCINTVKSCA